MLARVLWKPRLDIVMSSEKRYPIRAWRIGKRSDRAFSVTIVFWVRGGGGYQGEESAFLELRKANGWVVTDFSSVY